METLQKFLIMQNYQCIVIWTFHEDTNDSNYQKLMKILKEFKFEEIDQSTRGSIGIDINSFTEKLSEESFIYHRGDFIKIAYTNSPDGIMVHSIKDKITPIDEQHFRMLNLMFN